MPSEPMELEPFDIAAPLPNGTVLLEASAGTGKTWTIGALVTRFVAEGEATLDEMLVVTFGRAASQELRQRVRDSLSRAEQALTDPWTVVAGEDAAIDLLLAVDDDERDRRRARLRAALSGFDGATIATTHQFCQLVLTSLGVAGDTDPSATLVEDLDDLLLEVVDDLYVRGFAGSSAPPAFSREEAIAIARAVQGDPQATIQPEHPDPGSVAQRRVGFARLVRAEMARRMRRLGVLGYDDLLSQLADALEPEDAPARAQMRRRWTVVLVDEFQDTDPVQWQVLDRAFNGHAKAMVLIGDPKQAIYAFRGGDVVTYLKAAQTAQRRQTLAVDRRADAPLVEALQRTWGGVRLGDDDITVRPVRAAHEQRRLVGAHAAAPLRVRIAPGRTASGRTTTMRIDAAREIVGRDVARDIARLLGSGATFEAEPGEVRPVRAGDVAVLAHTGKQLNIAWAELRRVGIPAVLAGGGSVFRTPAATEWLTVLEAMEQPHRSARVRAAALTSFIGYTAAELDAGGDDLTDRVAARLRWWAALFATRGVAAVLESATSAGLAARVLAHSGGERDLTDLRHVGELLHEVGLSQRLGLVATTSWMRERMAEDVLEPAGARTRRLDSDASAVQLSTIHGSKGLQYPVVYAPFLFDRWVSDDPPLPRFHDEQGRRCLDVGGEHPGRSDNVARALTEEAGESLRLFYVALTRAQSQVVTWWSPATTTPASPLHRMLLGRRSSEVDVPDSAPVPPAERAREAFDRWFTEGGPVWEVVDESPVTAPPVEGEAQPLQARRFDRDIDAVWRRTSYSALTRVENEAAPAGGAAQVSEPEVTTRDDEPDAAEIVSGADPLALASASAAGGQDVAEDASAFARGVPSPMATLPVGATFGSLVHQVLENADPSATDLRAELADRIHDAIVQWPVDLDRALLADALHDVMLSPLGPLAPGTRLADVSRRDRLCEMEFELPLAGGDFARTGAPLVLLSDLAEPLRRHLPEGDPVRPYADVLDAGALGEQELRGYLTGSLDVVMRVGERYLVADYKTNWLGPIDEPLTAYAYRPRALDEAMGHSSYPLQAVLYAVVLHRYLRWRVRDYDPQRHLGGVLYLYVRGMCGPATPVLDGHPCGVFSWQPPAALVVELSDLLDGRRT